MRAYDCIRGTTRMVLGPSKRLVGTKHVMYCVAMTFFNRPKCKYVPNSS